MTLTEAAKRYIDPKVSLGTILHLAGVLVGVGMLYQSVTTEQQKVLGELGRLSREVASIHQTYVRRDVESVERGRLIDRVDALVQRVERLERQRGR